MKLSGLLYKSARIINNVESFSNPKKAPKRAKNIIVGKLLSKIGFWKLIWG